MSYKNICCDIKSGIISLQDLFARYTDKLITAGLLTNDEVDIIKDMLLKENDTSSNSGKMSVFESLKKIFTALQKCNIDTETKIKSVDKNESQESETYSSVEPCMYGISAQQNHDGIIELNCCITNPFKVKLNPVTLNMSVVISPISVPQANSSQNFVTERKERSSSVETSILDSPQSENLPTRKEIFSTPEKQNDKTIVTSTTEQKFCGKIRSRQSSTSSHSGRLMRFSAVSTLTNERMSTEENSYKARKNVKLQNPEVNDSNHSLTSDELGKKGVDSETKKKSRRPRKSAYVSETEVKKAKRKKARSSKAGCKHDESASCSGSRNSTEKKKLTHSSESSNHTKPYEAEERIVTPKKSGENSSLESTDDLNDASTSDGSSRDERNHKNEHSKKQKKQKRRNFCKSEKESKRRKRSRNELDTDSSSDESFSNREDYKIPTRKRVAEIHDNESKLSDDAKPSKMKETYNERTSVVPEYRPGSPDEAGSVKVTKSSEMKRISVGDLVPKGSEYRPGSTDSVTVVKSPKKKRKSVRDSDELVSKVSENRPDPADSVKVVKSYKKKRKSVRDSDELSSEESENKPDFPEPADSVKLTKSTRKTHTPVIHSDRTMSKKKDSSAAFKLARVTNSSKEIQTSDIDSDQETTKDQDCSVCTLTVGSRKGTKSKKHIPPDGSNNETLDPSTSKQKSSRQTRNRQPSTSSHDNGSMSFSNVSNSEHCSKSHKSDASTVIYRQMLSMKECYVKLWKLKLSNDLESNFKVGTPEVKNVDGHSNEKLQVRQTHTIEPNPEENTSVEHLETKIKTSLPNPEEDASVEDLETKIKSSLQLKTSDTSLRAFRLKKQTSPRKSKTSNKQQFIPSLDLENSREVRTRKEVPKNIENKSTTLDDSKSQSKASNSSTSFRNHAFEDFSETKQAEHLKVISKITSTLDQTQTDITSENDLKDSDLQIQTEMKNDHFKATPLSRRMPKRGALKFATPKRWTSSSKNQPTSSHENMKDEKNTRKDVETVEENVSGIVSVSKSQPKASVTDRSQNTHKSKHQPKVAEAAVRSPNRPTRSICRYKTPLSPLIAVTDDKCDEDDDGETNEEVPAAETAEELMTSIEQPKISSGDKLLRDSRYLIKYDTENKKNAVDKRIAHQSSKGVHEIDKALRKLGEQCSKQKVGRQETQAVLNVLINPLLAPDVPTLLMHVLNYVAYYHRPDSPEDLNLPLDEKHLVTIMFQVEKRDKPHLRGLVSATVRLTSDIIVGKQSNIAARGLASLCRFVTELCRRRSDWRSPLRLCCDLCKGGRREKIVRQIDAVCGIWEGVFLEEFHRSKEVSIALKSIFYHISQIVKEPPQSPILREGISACVGLSLDLLMKDLCDKLMKVTKQIPEKRGSLDAEYWLASSMAIFCKLQEWKWTKENLLADLKSVLGELHDDNNKPQRAISAFSNICVDVFLNYPDRFEIKVLRDYFDHFRPENDAVCGIYALCLVRMFLEHKRPVPHDIQKWLQTHNDEERKKILCNLLRKRLVSDNRSIVLDDLL